METWTIIASVLGTCTAVCAIIISLLGTARTKKHDDTNAGVKDGTVLTELGYIRSGIDDIKRKQERQDEQHIEVISRLTAVEASAKQAHHRLDRIEDKESSNK